MNIIVWSRVSSREQREGYSIDAQLRAIRDRAKQEGWSIVREFAVAESAKRGADRAEFNSMISWARQSAKRENIQAIVCHKLDRACRNMRDAVRLQELEDQCGIKPIFIENHFAPGAAGQFSFNVMAAVAQYYSDNLRSEVMKGQNEKVEQGWLPANAPYGYFNQTADRDEPIKPDPVQSKSVVRLFELYSQGNLTFSRLADVLADEGHIYQKSQPKFHRTALSYILNNRFYIGKILWRGKVFQGKHKSLVEYTTFQICQDLLKGKNRRKSKLNLPLSAGLFHCKYCGQSITGELIRKKLKDGNVNEHIYYRCGNDIQGETHPGVRWRGDSLENSVAAELNKLKLPSPEIADWFKESLQAALSDQIQVEKITCSSLRKRESELVGKQDKLLSAYLDEIIDKSVYEAKSAEVKAELENVRQNLSRSTKTDSSLPVIAGKIFDLTQNAAQVWLGSNCEVRRELLQGFSLNRELSDASLCLTWSKPFDTFAKQADFKDGRGDRI